MSLKGSCLCGGIRYELDGPLGEAVHCHCSMCRKATGAAFRTRAAVPSASFHWRAGESLLARYESSPGEERTFCRVCGSTLVTLFRDRPEEIGLALGTLDDDPGVRPWAHVFVGSRAPWYEIDDDLPRFSGAAPPPLGTDDATDDPASNADDAADHPAEMTTFMRFTVRSR
jgi:hypothetical protein